MVQLLRNMYQKKYWFLWHSLPLQVLMIYCVFGPISLKGQCGGFTASATFSPVSCFGGTNGSVSGNVQNGTAPFSYVWNTTPTQTGQVITGLSAGSYQLTVTDANGCTANAQVSLTSPPAMFHASAFSSASCYGGTDGTASIIMNGGTGPYTYSWNSTPIQTTLLATGLSAGTYTVNVSDQNNCPYQAQVQVLQPPALALTLTYVPVSCTGNSDGQTSVMVTGGSPGFSYSWSGSPVQTTSVATGLSPGTYSVIVTDANSCMDSGSVQVLISPPIILQTQTQRVRCNGQVNGQASVLAYGGNPGYNYTWSTVPIQTSSVATGLGAGTYIVVVTDSRNCQENQTVLIVEPVPLQVSTTAVDVSCFGQTTGAASGSGFGGTAPYFYTWNTTPAQTVQTITGLSAGLYYLTLTDSSGCVAVGPATIRQPQAIIAQTTYSRPACFGGNDGQISASVSGGTTPYTYLWTGGQTSPTAIGLIAGSYTLNITDANGCTAQATQVLPQPLALQISVSGTDLTCVLPPDNGTSSVTVTGGTQPYSYLWSGGANPTQAYNSGLPAGTWFVQVNDANGCTQQGSIILYPPQRPIAHSGRDTFFCEGSGGAPISGSGSGGSPPYTYSWSPNNGSLSNAFTPSPWANPDSSTTYFLTITDAAGCSSINPAEVRITMYALPIVDAGPDLSFCQDGPAVFIQGQILNAVPGGYEVSWLPNQDLYCNTCLTTYASPPTTTIYTLRVRHILSGCSSDSTTLNNLSSVIVSVKPRPIADAGPDTTLCQGASATLCGTATGAGPLYTWNWSPNLGMNDSTLQCPVVTPPHTVKYFLISISNGCESPADSVMVSVIPAPLVDAGNIKNICEGDSVKLDGQSQQVGQQVYSWTPVNGLSNPNILTPMASPSNTQWYYLQASVSGCIGNTDSVMVIVHSKPVASAGSDTTICDTLAGLTLSGSYLGGIPPVRFQWTPSSSLSVNNILQPHAYPSITTLYYLTVSSGTPPTQCVSMDSVLVTVLPGIGLTASQDTDRICTGESVRFTSSAGQGNANFLWSPVTGLSDPQSPNPIASPMVSTTYIVQASEGQCRMWDTLEVYVHPHVEANFIFSQPEGCGEHKVRFQNRSSGGVAYTWNFGDDSHTSNLSQQDYIYDKPGTYYPQLIVLGLGGCRDTFTSTTPIIIHPEYKANAIIFPETPLELILPGALVQVRETEMNTSHRLWRFGDGSISTELATQHQYTNPGIYYIQLESWDSVGCKDLWSSGPIVIKAAEIFVPNVFTPNGDGINDLFKIEYSGDETFFLSIYDRWGVKQYETRNAQSWWNGSDLNGNSVESGVYFWMLKTGNIVHKGEVTILR